MAQPNEEFNMSMQQCAQIIKNAININVDKIQEVHDIFNRFNLQSNEAKTGFLKFIKKNQGLGARVVASSKSNDKYICVDPLVLRSTLDWYNLNNNGNNDNNNGNNDNNNGNNYNNNGNNDNNNGDDNNNNNHPAKRQRVSSKTEYNHKTVSNKYYEDIHCHFEQLKTSLDNITSETLRSLVAEILVKKILNHTGSSHDKDYFVHHEEVVKGINTYFRSIKSKFKGTVDGQVATVKRGVMSVIKEYTSLSDRKLKKIFPDVKWVKNTVSSPVDAREVADDVMSVDGQDGRDRGSSDGDSSSSDSDSSSSDSDTSSSDSDASSSDSEGYESNDDRMKKVIGEAFRSRKTRKDKVDLAFVNMFWHDWCPPDTNNRGEYCIACTVKTDSGDYMTVAEYHHRRVQTLSFDELYQVFLQSQEYIDFKANNPTPI